MKYASKHVFIKLITGLSIGLMIINPALAMQYQHFNPTTDFIGQIPDFQPRAYHIHISQKNDVLALLSKQGYEVIPASHEDVEHFLSSRSAVNSNSVQLAANFNLKRVYESKCSYRTKYCNGDECNNYPAHRDKRCVGNKLVEQTNTYEAPPEQPPGMEPTPASSEQPPTITLEKTTTTRSKVSVSYGRNFKLPNLGGSGKGDAAAVMLIVIGVVVIAALIIYAGKWLIDMINNDEDYYAYWWDIGTQFISLDTEYDEQGEFFGIKFSGGFVPNMHTHFGLTVEVGQMDLDLRYNRNSSPQRINVEGVYWLVGPTVRWLFANTDKDDNLAHNTYIFLELLGGKSDRSEVDTIGVARIGVNTALGEHLRVGLHYGAFYLGLDETQGFVNDGDNYWNMIGLEMGYQF